MKILITGGTGLIGTEISTQLIKKGHEVVYLSRRPGKNSFAIPEYGWDPETGFIDESAMEGVEAIINLAGASLNERWTPWYKNIILRSRVDSTRLLFTTLEKGNYPVHTLLSISAVGYYPHDYDKTFTEDDPPGTDFLSTVCQKWEREAQNFANLGIRVIRCRTGVVLSGKGGALAEIAKPARLNLGAPLGNGRQWMAWIHIRDVAGSFIHALENSQMANVYNVVGPYNVTNADFSEQVSKAVGKKFFLPNVPAWALRLALGEMSRMVLISNKVSSKKLIDSGYTYSFPDLKGALKDLLK